jgi:putative nucleotidyltransferase with HDIG domain
VLVVDDEPIIRDSLTDYLSSNGYRVKKAASGEEALHLISSEAYALVISDIRMPGLSGLDLLKHISSYCSNVEVIMITAVAELNTAVQSMKSGACDYITKPFDLGQVLESVQKALHMRSQKITDRRIADELLATVRHRTSALNSALQDLEYHRDTTLEALVKALDAREHETGCHSKRVQAYSIRLAEEVGLGGSRLTALARGALLHDIGKIGVPDSILLKPSKLNQEEWAQIKRHPIIGYEIVKGVSFLDGAAALIISHHERYDGQGYPYGLAGKDVPLEARLFAIIDTYDAMTSDRPYRRALTPEIARNEIRRCAGTQLDPELAAVFLSIPKSELHRIGREFS